MCSHIGVTYNAVIPVSGTEICVHICDGYTQVSRSVTLLHVSALEGHTKTQVLFNCLEVQH